MAGVARAKEGIEDARSWDKLQNVHRKVVGCMQCWAAVACPQNFSLSKLSFCEPLNKITVLVLLSILPCLSEYPKRIKRNPFAGLIALLNRPGTGDGTTQPASLLILAI